MITVDLRPAPVGCENRWRLDLGFIPGPVHLARYALGLQRGVEALHRRIIPDVARTGLLHRDRWLMAHRQAGFFSRPRHFVYFGDVPARADRERSEDCPF
jgi:hypothetical protein